MTRPTRRDVERRLDDLDNGEDMGKRSDPFVLTDDEREWANGWFSRLPPEDRAELWETNK